MSGELEEEIERKFLVKVEELKSALTSDIENKRYTEIHQGYLLRGQVTVRVRLALPPPPVFGAQNPLAKDEDYVIPGTKTVKLSSELPPLADDPDLAYVRKNITEALAPKHFGELTIKGPGAVKHYEKNVEIPVDLTRAILASCPGAVHKNRFRAGRWEIDRFLNVLDPDTNMLLWLAEIELKSEDEQFEKPNWLGREVTHDVRYTNARLSEHILRG